MKLRNLMWGACACILAAGCSNDDVAVDNGKSNIVQEGGNAYVNVRIAMAGGPSSRATEGEYEYGEDAEQAIKNIFFVFYDDNGKWMANGEQVGETATTDGTEENVEAIANAVVALTLPEDSPYPTRVVAYVNIPDAKTIFGGKDLGDTNTNDKTGTGEVTIGEGARATVLTGNGETVSSTDNGFMMTNSTYLNGSVEQIATPVERDNFFDTAEDAKAANPVDIYVERLAAKVSITNSAVVQDITNVGDYTLQFKPEGFALSGTNTKEYYLKNIQTAWSSWEWFNEPTDYRCFWAEDPNYDDADTYGTDAFNTLTAMEGVTFNNLGAYAYCLENTFDVNNMSEEQSTRVIVRAKFTNGTFYTLGQNTDVIYTETTMPDLFKSRLLSNPGFIAWVAENINGTVDGDNIELTFKDMSGKGGKMVVEGIVLDGVTYQDGGNFVDDDWLGIVNAGSDINKYEGGYAYYPVVIKHFGDDLTPSAITGMTSM